jgi:chromosome segregation ATPase
MEKQLEAEADGKKELQELIAQLEDELKDAQDEIAFQQAQWQTEKARNADFQEELAEADQKLEEVFAEKSKLITEKQGLVEKIENLEDDLATGQADQAMRERLEKEKAELQDKLEEVEGSLAQSAKKAKGLTDDKAAAEEKVEELESAVTKADRKASQARNEADDLSQQVAELTSQVAISAKKAKQHSAELTLEQEKTSAGTVELSEITIKLRKSETRVLELEGELEESNDKKDSMQRTITQLKRDLEDLSATDDLEAKVKALQAELRTKDDTLADAEEELEELTTDIGTLRKERDEARSELHKLCLEKEAEDTRSAPMVKRLQEQNAELQEDCDKYASRNSRLNAEKSEFESRCADADSALENERASNARKAKKINALEKRLALLVAQGGGEGASSEDKALWESTKKSLKAERDDAEDKAEGLTLSKRRLQREFDELQEMADAKEKENKRLRDQLAKMRRDISSMHDDSFDDGAEGADGAE